MQDDIAWDLLEEAWPRENRPKQLQRRSVVRTMGLDALLRLKKEVVGEEERKNLGEEVFTKDAKTQKIRYYFIFHYNLVINNDLSATFCLQLSLKTCSDLHTRFI